MNQKSFAYLAGALGALVVIILVATSGGLNKSTRALLEVEQQKFPETADAIERRVAGLKNTIAEDKELFRNRSAEWLATLDQAVQTVKAAAPKLAEAEALAAENDDEKHVAIEMALDVVRDARTGALAQLETVQAAANHLIDLRQNRKKSVEQARQRHERIQEFDFSGLRTEVERATNDWSGKKADLEKRLNRLLSHQTRSDQLLAVVTAEDAKELDEIDFTKLASATRDLNYLATDLTKSSAHIRALITQLYTSWDRILVDMAIEEGYEVTFRHKYKTTTVQITDPAQKTGKALPPQERWQNVPKAEFEKRKEQLGMAVAYKEAGKYDSEAVKGTPQPPGYSYVASPEQRSNQYGRWENRNGSSFWVFYGQYAFLRSMFWGPSYSPIGLGQYREYDSYRSRGRSYYGRTATGTPRYGSKGTATRSRYSSSRYVKTSGFKNSKYVKSKGTYKGTRYTARRSSSRSRSSSSSRSRSRSFGGGSRSFGGK